MLLCLAYSGRFVGFYFGSDASNVNRPELQPPQLSTLDVTPSPFSIANSGGKVTVRAVVKGGMSPYRYGLSRSASDLPTLEHAAGDGGWIIRDVELKDVKEEQPARTDCIGGRRTRPSAEPSRRPPCRW